MIIMERKVGIMRSLLVGRIAPVLQASHNPPQLTLPSTLPLPLCTLSICTLLQTSRSHGASFLPTSVSQNGTI